MNTPLKSTTRRVSALTGQSQDALTYLHDLSPESFAALSAEADKASQKVGGYPPPASCAERFLDWAERTWEQYLLFTCRREFWPALGIIAAAIVAVLFGMRLIDAAGLGAGQ